MRCDYLGCLDPSRAHSARACYGLMKRCRVRSCGGQRGHISEAHGSSRIAHLGIEDQTRLLREAFEAMEGWLTELEKEKVENYERELEELDTRGRRE